MKLSVIIPCFNAADTIGSQLEALANQQWSEPWEVIVSDNGSTDNSVKIVEQYKKKLPNLRIVDSSDKVGSAHARNVGVLAARSDALAFCDADDQVASGWVSAMGEAISRYDFVACKLDYEKLNEPWTLKYRDFDESGVFFQSNGLIEFYPHYLPHAAGASLGIKRSVHNAVGGFDETLLRLEDTDYCWRIQLTGIELHFVADAVIYHRFRHTIQGLYRQAFLWGEYNVFLYKKYLQLGMPKLSWRASIKAWLGLLKRLPQLLSKEERVKWIWIFGYRIGRLQGCLKYRVLAL